jgi:hypothetical protein
MEPQVERVVDKTRANFCEWFEPVRQSGAGQATSDEDGLRSAAERLFRSD